MREWSACRPSQRAFIKVLMMAAVLFARSAAAQTPITVTVDAMANRHAISPLVYGLSIATASDLQALNAPLNRLGGNNADPRVCGFPLNANECDREDAGEP